MAAAIEDVLADLDDAHHLAAPDLAEVGDVVVGRAADRGRHRASERLAGHHPGAVPGARLAPRLGRAVAGEGELALVAGQALVDDAADGLREAGVAHAVHHHLRHRGLALAGLAARLVVDRSGQAIDV